MPHSRRSRSPTPFRRSSPRKNKGNPPKRFCNEGAEPSPVKKARTGTRARSPTPVDEVIYDVIYVGGRPHELASTPCLGSPRIPHASLLDISGEGPLSLSQLASTAAADTPTIRHTTPPVGPNISIVRHTIAPVDLNTTLLNAPFTPQQAQELATGALALMDSGLHIPPAEASGELPAAPVPLTEDGWVGSPSASPSEPSFTSEELEDGDFLGPAPSPSPSKSSAASLTFVWWQLHSSAALATSSFEGDHYWLSPVWYINSGSPLAEYFTSVLSERSTTLTPPEPVNAPVSQWPAALTHTAGEGFLPIPPTFEVSTSLTPSDDGFSPVPSELSASPAFSEDEASPLARPSEVSAASPASGGAYLTPPPATDSEGFF